MKHPQPKTTYIHKKSNKSRRMGFLFDKSISLLVLMLIVLDGYSSAEATPLEELCRMTSDEHFCLTDFGSGLVRAPIKVLASRAIQDIIDNMNITRITIEFLLEFGSVHDPALHTILTVCMDSYTPTYNSFVATAFYNLNNMLTGQLQKQAAETSKAAASCQAEFNRIKSPFEADMNNLTRLSNILDMLAGVFLSSS